MNFKEFLESRERRQQKIIGSGSKPSKVIVKTPVIKIKKIDPKDQFNKFTGFPAAKI